MLPHFFTITDMRGDEMKIKYNSDIISGAIFALIAAVIWCLIPYQINTMETTSVTAQTIPHIVIGGMFIFSVALLIQGIFATPKKEFVITSKSFKSESFKKELKSVVFALLLIIFAVLLNFTGFIIASLFLVISVLIFYGARKWYYYAISISTVGIVYYIFKIILSVTLP